MILSLHIVDVLCTWDYYSDGRVHECAEEAEQGGHVCCEHSDSVYLEPEDEFIPWLGRTVDELFDTQGNLWMRSQVRDMNMRTTGDVWVVQTRNEQGQRRCHNCTWHTGPRVALDAV